MFERFTEKAIKVIMLAQEEARRLGHNFVGTEQILLGLIGEGTGIAAIVLRSMDVRLRDARIEVENIIGRGTGNVAAEIPFTPRCKRVLELSLEEARELIHNYIGTEHLLLGLIREGDGVAVRVLETLGINLSELRNQVIIQLNENKPDRTNDYLELVRRLLEGHPEKILEKYSKQLNPSLAEKMDEIATLKELEGNQSDADFLRSMAKKVRKKISPLDEITQGVIVEDEIIQDPTSPNEITLERTVEDESIEDIIPSDEISQKEVNEDESIEDIIPSDEINQKEVNEDETPQYITPLDEITQGVIVEDEIIEDLTSPNKITSEGTFEDEPIIQEPIPTPPKETIIVSQQGDADYTTIGEAIKNADAGSQIKIKLGTYYESLVIDKSLNIIGDGKLAEIIIESDSDCILVQSDQEILVEGLTLKCNAHEGKYAVHIPQGQLKLKNCDVTSESEACIKIYGENTKPEIDGCKIHHSKKTGVIFSDKSAGKLNNCHLTENGFTGIEITENSNPLISNCQIRGLNKNGIVVHKEGRGIIEETEIFKNEKNGILITTNGNPLVCKNSLIKENKRGIGISKTGLGRIESCKIIQNYNVDLEIEEGCKTVIKKCLLKRNEILSVWNYSFDTGWSQDSSSKGVIVEKKK